MSSMDYYSQETHLEAHPDTYNGEESQEEVDRQQEGFYSGHDFDENDNLDSAVVTIKPTSNRRDSSSGLVYRGFCLVLLILLIPKLIIL